MKKFLVLIMMISAMVFSLAVCATASVAAAGAGKAPDYSQKANWYQIPDITKEVDTFFIYPTEYIGMNEGDPDYAALDNPEMRDGVKNMDHRFMAIAYEDATNVFMPYYRQASLRTQLNAREKTGDARNALKNDTPYADITAALDYYFKNYNGGRPFIIAGHSQGSAITSLVLMNYFKEHPEYYDRMIAAYAIGYSITKGDLKANPHLKFATGESDTGVIISWNTEGPRNVKENAPNPVLLPNAISINPINWELDGTYAPASENLGSLVPGETAGEDKIGDLGADAQVDPHRGVVVTNTPFEPMEATDIFGPQSFHNGDYIFYYNNIKDNVAKRIAAYQNNAKANAKTATDYSQKASWCKLPYIISKDVDTFYIYSTSYVESSFKEGAPDYAPLDNPEMVELAQSEIVAHATVFEDSTNVFAPYYRQAGMRYAKEVAAKNGTSDAAFLGMPYDDITAALDYYFTHYNEGRPFIIAGHSQGSAMTLLVLKKYFKEHPDYYKRMVAAYAIGYAVTKDYLTANPHLKFANGENDTGVIVSWNTEGKQNVKENAKNIVVLPGAISINPLNWKLDETYVPSSKNLGSLIEDEKTGMGKIGNIGADAQINLARGVIVTNVKADPVPMTDFFGPASFHDNDYTFYYNNIRDNVAKRIATYLRKKK